MDPISTLFATLPGGKRRENERPVIGCRATRSGQLRGDGRRLAGRQFPAQDRECAIQFTDSIILSGRLWRGSGDHQRELAAREVRLGRRTRREFGKCAPIYGFEDLRQLAPNRRLSCTAEAGRKICEGRRDAMRRLEKHERARFARELRQALAALTSSGRQKTFETESCRGNRCNTERSGDGRGPGHAADFDACDRGGAHQLEARVRKQRRSGIAHENDVRACAQPLEDLGCAGPLIVRMQRDERAARADGCEQLTRAARVLCRDEIGFEQRRARPGSEISEVADGCRDDVESASLGSHYTAPVARSSRRHPARQRKALQLIMSFARTLLRALLALAFGLALAGCPSLGPRGEGPPTLERAERLERQGDAAAAARQYEALARGNAGSARVGLAQRAARAWLAARLPAEGERVLGEIQTEPHTPAQRIEQVLLQAEIALARGQGALAWQTLAALPEPVGSLAHGAFLDLRMRAAFASARPLEGVQAGLALERVAASAAERGAARARLLDALRDSAARGIQLAPAASADPLVRGWLEAGLLAASAARNPLGAPRALSAWSRHYPGHPATDLVRAELLGSASVGKPGFATATHVALLLPVSGRTGGPATSIRDGFLAAYYEDPVASRPRLRIYDTNEIGVEEAITRAAAGGATFIVGPLTREEVGLAADFAGARPPLLALNFLPAERSAPQSFHQFALSPEDEAREVAKHALASGQRRAVALVPAGDWGNRVLAAFREALLAGGGTLLAQASYDTLATDYSQAITQVLRLTDSRARHRRLEEILGTKLVFEPRRRGDLDFIFAPGPFGAARLMRPQLRFHYAGNIPTYATSDAWEPEGQGSRDMEGLLFPDMPWMLGSSELAVEVRNHVQAAWDGGGPPRNRLFAFGYDAYRLLGLLTGARPPGRDPATLDGLSGRLSVDDLGRVRRELDWAQLVEGQAQVVGAAD